MAVHMSKHLQFPVTQTINRIDSRAVSKNCSTKGLDDREWWHPTVICSVFDSALILEKCMDSQRATVSLSSDSRGSYSLSPKVTALSADLLLTERYEKESE